jgi:hypothetical protein
MPAFLGPGQLPGEFHDNEVLQDRSVGPVRLVEAGRVLADDMTGDPGVARQTALAQALAVAADGATRLGAAASRVATRAVYCRRTLTAVPWSLR